MRDFLFCRRSWRLAAATATLCLATCWSTPAAAQGGIAVASSGDANHLSIQVNNQPLLEYRFGEVPFKPYVKQFCSPSGLNVLRDSPADHKHHHALMFAVAVNGVDFWSEDPRCGSQVAKPLGGSTGQSNGGLVQEKFSHRIDWLAPDKTLLAREERKLDVYAGSEIGASLLTWRTRLEPPEGKDSIKLGGSHYFGLGMRFVESMDKGGRFFNSAGQEGEIVRGKERLVKAAWCAYTAAINGKPVTVALFDHPGNPRHPATMFTMSEAFAYMSATLNLWKESLEVKAGSPLELCYGVAVFDGQVEPEKVKQAYQKWLALAAKGKIEAPRD